MDLRVFGSVHLIYLAITISLSIFGLVCAKKFAKSEKSQTIVLKISISYICFCYGRKERNIFSFKEVFWF